MAPVPARREPGALVPPLVRPDLPRPARYRARSARRPRPAGRRRAPQDGFFNASYANYDHCLDGRLRLVPDDDQIESVRSDYDAMRGAGTVGDDAPESDTLMDAIGNIEAEASRWT